MGELTEAPPLPLLRCRMITLFIPGGTTGGISAAPDGPTPSPTPAAPLPGSAPDGAAAAAAAPSEWRETLGPAVEIWLEA